MCGGAEPTTNATLDHVANIRKSKSHATYTAYLWKLNQDCDSPEETPDQANWRERLLWVSEEGRIYYNSELNSRDNLLLDDTTHNISLSVLPQGIACFKHAIRLESRC